jgi:hypothetical protein
MALNGIPIDPSQSMGDSLSVLNSSFIELDSRTLNLSAYIGGSSGNLYSLVQDVSGDLYTLIQQTSGQGGGGGLTVPVKFSFAGDGLQTSFGLTGTNLSTNPVSYRVTLNGVVQDPSVDFNIVGSNLVFTSPPPAGVTIVAVTADEFGNVTVTLSGGDYNLRALSATWNNASTVVQTNSANWNYQGTDLKDLSANWQNTFTTVSSTSSNWINVYSTVLSNSATWNTAGSYQGTDLKNLSANWQNTFTTVSSNSANWVTINTLNAKFFPLTGGTITGATQVNANLTIYGNLSATGNSYFNNTVYSTTSALSVINIGNTGPAFYVGNNGTGDIASFYDLDQNIEVLHVGGSNGTFPNVGIKTSTPNETLTVNGTLSTSGIIYSQEGVVKPLSGINGIVVNNSATNVTVLSVDSDYLSSQITQNIQYFGTPDSFFSPLW